MLRNLLQTKSKNTIETKSNDSSDDQWEDWVPKIHLKRGKKTPHCFQEKHSKTKKVVISDADNGRDIHCHRRILDSRLWDGLEVIQQDAAISIEKSFRLLSSGTGYSKSDLTKIGQASFIDRGLNDTEFHAEITNRYIEWTKLCLENRISHAIILDVLVFGKSLSLIDCERRVRKGTAKLNLIEGLDLYCKIRGWGNYNYYKK